MGEVRVLKFGGSILTSGEDVEKICSMIGGIKEEMVIVLSALNGITNDLCSILELAGSDQDGWRSELSRIRNYHMMILQECVQDPQIRSEISSKIKGSIIEMEDLMTRNIGLEMDGYDRDLFLTYGERLAVQIISGALVERGSMAAPLTMEEVGLRVKGHECNIIADIENSNAVVRSVLMRTIENGSIPIVTGFYGCNEDGKPICFGRNGSDYSSAVIANILGANQLEIWRDVPGIMSADPRIIQNAERIDRLTYDEAAELAFFGALILHSRTVEPLRKNGIPLLIRDITDPEIFTLVNDLPDPKVGKVRSVSFTREIGVIKLKGSCLGNDPEVLIEVMNLLASSGLKLKSMMTGQSSIMLILDRKDISRCADIINSKTMPSIGSIEVIEDHSLVGIVGEGIFDQHGVASKVLQAVGRKGIHINMITAGPSDVAYYFVVKESDLESVVSTIHDDYIMEIVKITQSEHEERIRRKRQVQMHPAS